ncbi:MAG TPA: hypothetical protein VK034_31325, partial [Enhygromyxa sp.]|nr:hypothetical protein [Enhygromyxa sp.]
GDPKPAEGLADLFVARLDGNNGAADYAVTFADQNNGSMGWGYLAIGDGQIFLANADSSANLKLVDFGDGLGAQQGYFFLAALDLATGGGQWSRAFSGLRGIYGLAADSGNSVVITGALEGTADFGAGDVMSFMSSRDIFAVKYDVVDGSYRWGRHIGDYNQQSNMQNGFGVAFDAGGHVFVAGSFWGVINWGDEELTSGFGFGGSDGYVAKLAP